jgi:glycine betaine/proline transport system permease protein
MQQQDGNIFDIYELPLGDWVETGVDWLDANASGFFDAVKWPIEQILSGTEGILLWLPWYVIFIALIGLGWWKEGWKLALINGVSLLLIGFLGYWDLTMITLSMILTALAFSIVVGVPMGILAATNDTMENIIRPLLDAMQTIHPFVYLVPIVMFFGIGQVPGTLATIIFALPPIVRLTNLGIRQVPKEVVEAGRAFGSDDRQLLFDVQLPLALPTIMAGLNQTLMLALSMVVIVALIAGGGLGQEILRSIGRIDIGRAVSAGLAVLLLAVVLDRTSQIVDREATAT